MNTNVFRKIWVSLLGCVSLVGEIGLLANTGEMTVDLVTDIQYKDFVLDEDQKTDVKFCQGNYTFRVLPDEQSVEIVGFLNSASEEEIIIPATVTHEGVDYSVVALADKSFSNCNDLKKIQVPSSVYSFGEWCFSGCTNLENIQMPTSMKTIGRSCFWYCTNLKSIQIGEGVEILPDRCFGYCSNLAAIEIPATVTTFEDYCFSSCSSLEQIDIPYSVTFIGYHCFSDCSSLKSIEIPSSVTTLRDQCCFINCTSLTDVKLPEGITSLGYGFFSGCVNLTTVDIPSSVISLGGNCFADCTKLSNIEIPSNVKSIGYKCFVNCSALTSISIPDNVTSLGKFCFSHCTGLESVSLSSNLTYLNESCFEFCSALKTIVIPSGITHIGESCFWFCDHLEKVSFPTSLVRMYDYSFAGCDNLETIDIPSNVLYLGNQCFYDCSSLKNVELHYGLQTLGANCFASCTSLKSINIPSSVLVLGGHCFSHCTDLSSVRIPSSITSFGEFCFSNCSNLLDVDIEDGLVELGKYCFNQCEGIKSIKIPSSIKGLSRGCFCWCTSLTSIDIPSSVTSFGDDCFWYCKSLEHFQIPQSVTSLGAHCFGHCENLTKIEIPTSITALSDGCFEECSSIENIDIPQTVTYLGHSCFYNCTNLKTVCIPPYVNTLGEWCFRNCSNLENIVIPSTVTEIYSGCFSGCNNLHTIRCHIENPLPVDNLSDNFSISIYVPDASLEKYKSHQDWNKYVLKSMSSESEEVEIGYLVSAQLINLVTDEIKDDTEVKDGHSFSFMLKSLTNYVLPQNILIKQDENNLSDEDYMYDPVSGLVTIYAVHGNIRVVAVGVLVITSDSEMLAGEEPIIKVETEGPVNLVLKQLESECIEICQSARATLTIEANSEIQELKNSGTVVLNSNHEAVLSLCRITNMGTIVLQDNIFNNASDVIISNDGRFTDYSGAIKQVIGQAPLYIQEALLPNTNYNQGEICTLQVKAEFNSEYTFATFLWQKLLKNGDWVTVQTDNLQSSLRSSGEVLISHYTVPQNESGRYRCLVTNYVDENVQTSLITETNVVLTMTPDPIPDPVPLPTYKVEVQQIDGAIIEALGPTEIEHGMNFSFKINIQDGYNASNIEVRVNGNVLLPDIYGTYTINQVTSDLFIIVTGVIADIPSSIEGVRDGVTIWISKGELHFHLNTDANICIIDFKGAVVKQFCGSFGDYTVNLPEGYYIVKINEQISKVKL